VTVGIPFSTLNFMQSNDVIWPLLCFDRVFSAIERYQNIGSHAIALGEAGIESHRTLRLYIRSVESHLKNKHQPVVTL
jgi:hypothetical protein